MASTKALSNLNESPQVAEANPASVAVLDEIRNKVSETAEASTIDRLKDLKARKDKHEIQSITREWLKTASNLEELNAIMDQCVDAGLLKKKKDKYSRHPITDVYLQVRTDLRGQKKEADPAESTVGKGVGELLEKTSQIQSKLAATPKNNDSELSNDNLEQINTFKSRLQETSNKLPENFTKKQFHSVKKELYSIMSEAAEAGLVDKEEIPYANNPEKFRSAYKPEDHPLVEEMKKLTREMNQKNSQAKEARKLEQQKAREDKEAQELEQKAKEDKEAKSSQKEIALKKQEFMSQLWELENSREDNAVKSCYEVMNAAAEAGLVQRTEEGKRVLFSPKEDALVQVFIRTINALRNKRKADKPEAKEASPEEQHFIKMLWARAEKDDKAGCYNIMDLATEAGIVHRTQDEDANGRVWTKYSPENSSLVQVLKQATKKINQKRLANKTRGKVKASLGQKIQASLDSSESDNK